MTRDTAEQTDNSSADRLISSELWATTRQLLSSSTHVFHFADIDIGFGMTLICGIAMTTTAGTAIGRQPDGNPRRESRGLRIDATDHRDVRTRTDCLV